MFIAYAFAGTVQQQATAVVEPLAWYWLALISLAMGSIGGFSFTQGAKMFLREQPKLKMSPSIVRLTGRVSSCVAAVIGSVGVEILQSVSVNWQAAAVLGAISFMVSSVLWDKVVEPLIGMIAPKLAAKL